MTATTISATASPRKPTGWCAQNNVEHAWESGPTLTINPPILTRRCVNCGKGQRYIAAWQDE